MIHLDIYLDEKLNFNHHIKEKIAKSNKGKVVIKKLNNVSKKCIINYLQIICTTTLDQQSIEQSNNESFFNKLERIQFNAALAGAIQVTSETKLYKESGLEYLKCRRCFRQLCTLSEIKTKNILPYLVQLLPKVIVHIIIVTQKILLHTKAEYKFSRFFPSQGLLLNKIK